MRRVCSAGLVLALALIGAGCGGPGKLVRVEGIVTLDGQPLENATVSFVPQGAGGQQASGRTDANGTFSLTTFNTNDGAFPGDYKIVVSKSDASTLPEEGPIDQKQIYKLMFKSTLPQKGKKGAVKAKSVIPADYRDQAKTPLKQRIPADGKITIELKSKGGT